MSAMTPSQRRRVAACYLGMRDAFKQLATFRRKLAKLLPGSAALLTEHAEQAKELANVADELAKSVAKR